MKRKYKRMKEERNLPQMKFYFYIKWNNEENYFIEEQERREGKRRENANRLGRKNKSEMGGGSKLRWRKERKKEKFEKRRKLKSESGENWKRKGESRLTKGVDDLTVSIIESIWVKLIINL